MKNFRKLSALIALSLVTSACSEVLAPPPQAVAVGDRLRDAKGRVSYIVVFRDGATDVPGLARQLTSANGGELRFTYEHTIQGFAAFLPAAAINGLSRHPMVAFIEIDAIVKSSGTQTNPSWGLDRIDQRNQPLDNAFSYYTNGSGVRAYILDTGIRSSHVEFGGRVSSVGFYAYNDGIATGDCHGHGTHVAGTVGGSTYGVAKAVTLVPVRVLDCDGYGTWSNVIAGVDWVKAHHVKPAVANMSLGGPTSVATDSAVAKAIAAGVAFVVAAGNDGANACNASPARLVKAITVGSINSSDARANDSNFGTCLDIFAPGVGITSAYHLSNTSIAGGSGTSMAAPHVTGAAALLLQHYPTLNSEGVTSSLLGVATTGKVTSAGSGSPNRLLFTNYIFPQPVGILGTYNGGGNPQLIWRSVDGATSYEVVQWQDAVFYSPEYGSVHNYGSMGTVSNSSDTTATDWSRSYTGQGACYFSFPWVPEEVWVTYGYAVRAIFPTGQSQWTMLGPGDVYSCESYGNP